MSEEMLAPEPTDETSDLWDFIGDEQEIAPAGPSVLLKSTNDAARHAPFAEGEETMSIAEAVTRANLTVNAATKYLLDGAFVPADTQVGPGATVTLIGPAKGG